MKLGNFWAQCSCVTCALIPFEAVEIALNALYTIDIRKNPATYTALAVTTDTAFET